LSEPSEKTIELSGQLNVAHQEATKKDKSISELSGKLNIAHQEATKKDKSISELSGRLNVAHQEATKKAKSISELSGTLNDMQLELAHIKSDLNSANDQKRELQKALKEFNSDLDSKEQHLQSTRSQLVFEKAEHERLATEVDVKNGIINELQGRTEEAVRRIEDSEKELTQLRGERATLKASQQEATQVREAKAALATQLKASHAELDKLRGENALLDNHLKDSKNELTQLREEKMTFGVKLNSFERNAIECAEAKSTLESNLDASKGEVLRLGANKTKLEADKVALGQELQTTKAEANSDVEKLREKLELAETKIQELSMTHDEQLQSQSATMERERNAAIKALRERLERECSSLATKHIQDLEVYHTRISQTRLQRDKYNNIINDLAAETSYHIALTEMGIIGDWRPYELQPTTSLNFEQSRFHGKVANMITLSNEIPKKIFQYMWTRQQGGLIDDDSLILDLWRTWEDSTAMTMDDRHRFFYTIYRFCFLLLKSPYTHQRHLDEWLACQLVIALANSGSPNNHHGLRMEILEDIQKVDRLKLTITGRMGLSHLERLLNPVANHKFPMHLSLPYEIEPTHTRQFYCCSQRSNQTWMVSWTEIETNLHLVLCPLEDAVIPRLPVIYHDDMTKFGFGWWGEFLYMIAMVGESTLSWRLLVRFDDEFHKWAEEHIVDSFPTALLTSAEET
jgi:predicted  nucleic acid-binding Zn-ribbon protein